MAELDGSNQPPRGVRGRQSRALGLATLGIALLGGGCIACFGSLSSIKLGLCAGPISIPSRMPAGRQTRRRDKT